MNLNILTSLVALVISLCALISPLAVSILNNRFALKLRNLDLEEARLNRKAEVIENFFRYAGVVFYNYDDEARSNYGEYRNLIYLYLPSSYHDDISAFNDYVSKRDAINASELLKEISIRYATNQNKLK